MEKRYLILVAVIVLAVFTIVSGYFAKNQNDINLATMAGCLAVGAFLAYLLSLLADKIEILKGKFKGKMKLRHSFLFLALALAIFAGASGYLKTGGNNSVIAGCLSIGALIAYLFGLMADTQDTLSRRFGGKKLIAPGGG